MWGAHWTIQLEKRGVPAVYLVDDPFALDVQTSCERNGMPGLRRVFIPHPCGDIKDEYPRQDIRVVVLGGETNPFTQVWHMSRPSSVVIDKWN